MNDFDNVTPYRLKDDYRPYSPTDDIEEAPDWEGIGFTGLPRHTIQATSEAILAVVDDQDFYVEFYKRDGTLRCMHARAVGQEPGRTNVLVEDTEISRGNAIRQFDPTEVQVLMTRTTEYVFE